MVGEEEAQILVKVCPGLGVANHLRETLPELLLDSGEVCRSFIEVALVFLEEPCLSDVDREDSI